VTINEIKESISRVEILAVKLHPNEGGTPEHRELIEQIVAVRRGIYELIEALCRSIENPRSMKGGG
jgi:hypothetical protein